MMDELELKTFFGSKPDSHMYQYLLPFDKLKTNLAKFGLTPNESKVFIFLGKYGSKTVLEATRALKMHRTETYKLLDHLQNMGIVYATFDKPRLYSAISPDDAIQTLIKKEMERVKALEQEKNEIVELWNEIPSFRKEIAEEPEEKFQMLKGMTSIRSMIEQIIANTKENLLILGSEKFFTRLYHSDTLDLLCKLDVNIRVLTTCSENSLFIFNSFSKGEVRNTRADLNDICFLIRDNSELIYIVKNSPYAFDLVALHTDSSTLTYTMKLLFDQFWKSSSDFKGLDSLREKRVFVDRAS
jgi:sugar-specific transcriptional regulator TrmB